MVIEAVKSIGRAKCIICNKIIKTGDIQLRIAEYGGYTKSCHFTCVEKMTKDIRDKDYVY